jgi:hypothetical protein
LPSEEPLEDVFAAAGVVAVVLEVPDPVEVNVLAGVVVLAAPEPAEVKEVAGFVAPVVLVSDGNLDDVGAAGFVAPVPVDVIVLGAAAVDPAGLADDPA